MAKAKTSGKANGADNKDKVPLRDKVVRQLDKFCARVQKVEKRLAANAPQVAALLEKARDMVGDAANEVEKLPTEFRFSASKGAGGRVTFAEGATVSIREKVRSKWTDLLVAAEMESLVVEKIIGSRARVKTQAGTVLVIPRGALTVKGQAQAQQ
jgi:hypothetical protein